MLYSAFRPSNDPLYPLLTRVGPLTKNFAVAAYRAERLKGQVRDSNGCLRLDYTDEGNATAFNLSNMHNIEETV